MDDFPLSLDCLLDSGSHLVLIRPETVALRLPVQRLNEPLEASLALDGAITTTTFTTCITLSLSSLNNAWSSRPVVALLVPGLCTNILLGLPFLSQNNIVIDHALRTAHCKSSGFDLLNENASPFPQRHIRKKHIRIPAPHERLAVVARHRKAILTELKWKCSERLRFLEEQALFEFVKPINAITDIKATIKRLSEAEHLTKFEPIPHVDNLPLTETARIELKDAYRTISTRTYPCPRQFRDSFAKLLQLRLDSGFIRPSSSRFASPSFIIPKVDRTVLPRWVCDYRQLNDNTVPDNFPLPRIDDILSDCARGKIWATIDMTDSFFQTRMHPDDIHKMAVTTPFGLYEWTVMPMGFCNSPAIHQRRVTNALRQHIGKICHIYLDDIVIRLYWQTHP